MAIFFNSENLKKPLISYSIVKKWLKLVIKDYGKITGDITFIFCKDSYLIDINKKFLNHDYFTDIITFDYCDRNVISGDIFISLDRVLENSELFDVLFKDELLRVIIHGVLHLLGYNDSTDIEKQIMREQETKFILMFKFLENGCIE